MTKSLEERIAEIEARNEKVEDDKAWETSWVRKISIMILTYAVVSGFLYYVVKVDPWINALVPVIGYALSTFTISLLKQRWLASRK